MANQNIGDRNLFKELDEFTPQERGIWANNNRIKIAENDKCIIDFVKNSLNTRDDRQELRIGKIGEKLGKRIIDETETDLTGYKLQMRSDDIRHIFKKHGNAQTEALRGQQAITADDIARFTEVITQFDEVKKTNGGLCFTKDIDGKITAITAQADGNRSKSLSLKTMYKGIKRRNDTQATNAQKEPKP